MATTTLHQNQAGRLGRASAVVLAAASLLMALAIGYALARTAVTQPSPIAPSEIGTTIDSLTGRAEFLAEINEIPIGPISTDGKPQLGGSGAAPVFFD